MPPSTKTTVTSDLTADFALVEQWHFPSLDGQHQYQATILIPKTVAPDNGYACCCFLDGNSVLSDIQQRRQAYADQNAIIVTIGYQGEADFFVTQRCFDYIPPVNAPAVTMAEQARNLRGGGAELFLDLLAKRVLEPLKQRFPLNVDKLTLWGHSFAGVLVLYSLFTRPQLFNRYLAADPSLWWNAGYLTKLPTQTTPLHQLKPPSSKQLLLLVGSAAQIIASGKPRPLRPGVSAELAAKVRAERMQVPVDAAAQFCQLLEQQRASDGTALVKLEYRFLPEVQHRQLLHESLLPALELANRD